MDLSKIEGLTEQQTAAITAILNTETEGLRNKNEELIGEKRAMQGSVAEQAQQVEDARLAAVKANEEALKSAGDMEGLKTHYETQLAEQTATANEAAKAAQNALLSRDKGTVLNKALGLIHDDYKGLAEAQLSNMLKISYNDQQQPITTFEYEDKVVANNIEEFKSWAGEQSQFSKNLKGVDSSGAGTTRSQSNSVASGGENTAFEQRLRSAGLT